MTHFGDARTSELSDVSDYLRTGWTDALIASMRDFKSRRKDTGMRHGPLPTRHAPSTAEHTHHRLTVLCETPSSRATYDTLTNRSGVVIVDLIYDDKPIFFERLSAHCLDARLAPSVANLEANITIDSLRAKHRA